MGGLVGIEIGRNGRQIKSSQSNEEICKTGSCQVPQRHNTSVAKGDILWVDWVQCDSAQCGKWFHRQCAGVAEDEEFPRERQWFCGCSTTFNRNDLSR